MSCLYLGLDPPPGVFHYPVIATQKLDTPELDDAIFRLEEFTHMLFTSKQAVRHWTEVGPFAGKEAIAIGPGTASELKQCGMTSMIAHVATQEGVIALIEAMLQQGVPLSLLYPHSTRARPLLKEYLLQRGVRFLAIPLYQTYFQRPEPVPNPLDFDEIVFTSPSTVDGFLKIFGALPQGPRLTPIGPITAWCLL